MRLIRGLKNRIKRTVYGQQFPKAMADALVKTPFGASGVSQDGLPWVQLKNGLQFFAYLPSKYEIACYPKLPDKIKRVIQPECIRVARLVVSRYQYPHALANCAPPYSRQERAAFGVHQQDLIVDLGLSEKDQEELSDRFEVRPGDTVIEAGPYMGFGTLRLSHIVGSNGRVIAIEADPFNHNIIARNVDANHLENVTLLHNTVWNESALVTLHRSESDRQQQSVFEDVHPECFEDTSEPTIDVEAMPIDAIVEQQRLEHVSLVCITINGAEVEAVQGMRETLNKHKPMLTIAGFKRRDGEFIHEKVCRLLHAEGYNTAVGPEGRVYGWSL